MPMVLGLADLVPFVARPEAMAVLEGAWDGACAGDRRVVLVAGEAGTGKTRLVTEFARAAHRAGGAVLYGGCAEGDAIPYAPFCEALHGLAHGLPAAARADLVEHAGSALGILSPAFTSDAGPREPSPGEVDNEQFAVWTALSAALDLISDRHPVLLVLDDLHWANPTTAALVDRLTRGATPTSTCIVVTFRTEAADITRAARSVLADLRRRPGTTRARLTGLDRDGVRAFVEAAAGHPLHVGLNTVIDFLDHQTSGNLFFLGELWRDLVETGLLVRPDRRWRLDGPLHNVATPSSVRDIVATRLARLPADTRDALEWATVFAGTFEVDVLAAALDQPTDEVLRVLEPAFKAGIIEETRPGTCRFTHHLVQRGAYDDQPPPVRQRRHLRLAAAFERVRGAAASGATATHLMAALPLGDRRAAIAAATTAASRARANVRYAEAAAHLDAACAAVEDDRQRAELLLALAEATMRAGDVAAAQRHALAAHEIGVSLAASGLIIESAVTFDEANWRAALHGDTSRRILDTALEHADDERTTVRLHAARARALAFSGDSEEGRTIARQAMRRAREIGDHEAICTSYTALLFTDWTPDVVWELLGAAREFAEFAVVAGNKEWETWALDKQMFGTVTVGRLDETRAIARHHAALAKEIGQPLFRVLDRQAAALLATGEGRFADAEAHAREANDLGQFLSARDASGGFGVQMFSIRREQGRLDEARPVVEAIAKHGDEGAAWRPALALLYAELGMVEEASAQVESLVADGQVRIPHDSMRVAALAYLTDAAAITGATDAAEVLYRELEPMRGLVIQAGSFLAAYGAADRFLGSLATLRGRDSLAEQHFEAALRLETTASMPAWAVRTQLAYGRFLAGGRENTARAATLLRFAADTGGRLGMAPVATEASALLDGLRPEPGAHPVTAAGLTPRELAVLRQLVEGRSNRQIGSALNISHHTAANHVRAILLKAGCANRTEAASWAVRNGLVDDGLP